MKQVIMGTAGHVDHGKTTLIKALTGIWCDTAPEERKRGITINLGFAHLDLASGDRVSIVDVPGHRDFVHTMVCGASGIDFALLVIAADSGIMPQTREHVQIMQVLGVKAGIIALTRIDLVDEEIADMAGEEARELTKGTFLENCPVVRVSGITGAGIDELKLAIGAAQTGVRARGQGEVFRMFIDRFFTVAGFGAVVTGSVLSGHLRVETTAYLLPGDSALRVRRLERHGAVVDEVSAGDRASINLVGLKREDFQRGMVVADRHLRSTQLIDAQLLLFERAPVFSIWSWVTFLLGSYEGQARVHLVDRNVAYGREEVLVQIHLPKPLVVQNGDRFVIRSTSEDVTLGGGEVLDAFPLHHRRRPSALIDNLHKIAVGKLPERIAAEVRKSEGMVSANMIADVLNIANAQIVEVIHQGLPEDIQAVAAEQSWYLISLQAAHRLQQRIISELTAFHRRNPLVETGRTAEELAGIAGVELSAIMFLRQFLEELGVKGLIKKIRQTYVLGTHEVSIAPQLRAHIDDVENLFKNSGMHATAQSELSAFVAKQRIDEKSIRQILRYLTGSQQLYKVDELYLHASVVSHCRTTLLNSLLHNADGLTVAGFRDLVKGNRKICLALLSIYDAEGILEREGDLRKITAKGYSLATAQQTNNITRE